MLKTSFENFFTVIAARGKFVVMAISAVQLVVLHGELLLDEGLVAVAADEALLMPMYLIVHQVLSIYVQNTFITVYLKPLEDIE